MSTSYILYRNGKREVEIVESSARYSLDLYGYKASDCGDGEHLTFGPQSMSADETLCMAANIMYAVWCSYPDKANRMAAALARDIPNGAKKT